MSNKSEQLNIRMSQNLKNKLQEGAKRTNLSVSDFIRQSLEESTDPSKSLGNKVAELEKMVGSKWDIMERKLVMASATICSMDTGLSLDQCLSTVLELSKESNLNLLVEKLPDRGIFEKEILILHNKISEVLQISEIAKLSVSLILSTFIATLYSEDIFGPTPLSLTVMDRIRKAINVNRSPNT